MGKSENEYRADTIEQMASYLGITTGSPELQRLCDVYNAALPVEIPRWGTRPIQMIPTWGWCALSASCSAIETGVDVIVPIEIGVWEQVQIAKRFGLWRPNGSGYEPKPADLICYEWKDPSIDPQHKWHVGVIEVVGANYYQTIEGNAGGGSCVRRTVSRDDENIWGFIAPDYKSIADDPEPHYDKTPHGVKEVIDACTVHTGPGAGTPSLAAHPSLGATNLVDWCDSDGGWDYVRIIDVWGWVESCHLGHLRDDYVATTQLYVRSGPGTQYPPIKFDKGDGRGTRMTLRKGELVNVVNSANGWKQIEIIGVNGLWYGWCSGKYLRKA